MLYEFLAFIIPVVVGTLTSSGFDYASKVMAILQKVPSSFRPVLVAAIAFFIFKLGSLIGVQVGLNPTELPAVEVGEWVAALMAFLFKTGKQVKEVRAIADATKPEHDRGA